MKISEYQELVLTFTQKYNLQLSCDNAALDLISEIGEVSKEILLATNYGRSEFNLKSNKIQDELGDVLYSLLNLANCLNCNLENALEDAIRKYQERIAKKGGPGS